jgi:hypothetical protein
MMPTSTHKKAAITIFAISLASVGLWAKLGFPRQFGQLGDIRAIRYY